MPIGTHLFYITKLQRARFEKARNPLNFTIMETKTNVKQQQQHVIEFVEVKKTPFYIGKIETTNTNNETKETTTTTEYRVMIGNNVISQAFETEAEAHKFINKKPWELISALCYITATKFAKQ